MTEPERNQLSGKALEAYDRMLEQVQSRLRTVQETSMETLEEEIDKAIEAEQELQEMTRDELSLLGAYLQRDLEHLLNFVGETGEGLAEWLQLDLSAGAAADRAPPVGCRPNDGRYAGTAPEAGKP